LFAAMVILSMLISACAVPVPPSAPADGGEGSQLEQEIVDQTSGLLNPDVSGEVELWHFWGSPVRRTAVRRIVALCNDQLPNVEIIQSFKPWGDIWTANIAAVAAGSRMPDIIVED